MDMYKLKFTILQQEIMRLLFIHSGQSFNARGLAKRLNVSPTAIAKSLAGLEKENLIKVKKDQESKRLAIELNKDNYYIFHLKRAENLKMVYESGLVELLSEKLPGSTLVLFGSYAFGEDTIRSDIDIAVISSKEKEIDLIKFEKLLERKISLNFYPDFKSIDKNLKESILNGIILKGAIQL